MMNVTSMQGECPFLIFHGIVVKNAQAGNQKWLKTRKENVKNWRSRDQDKLVIVYVMFSVVI